jgi:hypothetical protein
MYLSFFYSLAFANNAVIDMVVEEFYCMLTLTLSGSGVV